MRQIKTIAIAIIISLSCLTARGAFIVHSVKGQVTMAKGNQQVALKAGMKVTPADKVSIPQGAVLEIENDINHNIYTSTQNGTFTLSRMMLDAKVASDNNISAINSRLKVGGASADNGQRVYIEQGMVKRSLTEYDPQASMFAIDPLTLARCIREKGEGISERDSTLVSKLERTCDGALSVELKNGKAFPIYFNIITCDNGKYSLSCIGQPAGAYVLLPHQGIARTHPDSTDPGQRQLLIIANCSFDVDLLLEELNKQTGTYTDPLPDFPLSLYYF